MCVECERLPSNWPLIQSAYWSGEFFVLQGLGGCENEQLPSLRGEFYDQPPLLECI